MFDEAALDIARKLDSAAAWKVLAILPRHLDWTSWRPLRQADLAEELGLTQSAISKALAELVTLKIALRKDKGPAVRWKLPTEWGFKGSPGQYHNVRATQIAEEALIPPTSQVVAEVTGRKVKQRALTLLRSVDNSNKNNQKKFQD